MVLLLFNNPQHNWKYVEGLRARYNNDLVGLSRVTQ